MEKINDSSITTIHLLGLQTPHNTRYFIFFLFLVIYCVTICGNLLIIPLVVYSKTLHSPMYFFLSQLAISDMLIVTDIVPIMLHTIVVKDPTISFSGCQIQLYFFGLSEGLECLLLTVMCYDRYLAICKPLHYNIAMNSKVCWVMIVVCWILAAFNECLTNLMILRLKFCGLDVIDHFFCDLDPILQLSCSDTSIVQLEVILMNILFAVTPFFIIIVSYVYIIITIFKILSITGRQKVFSTCSSHLTVVSIFYGTLVCVYFLPSKGKSGNINKYLSLLYTVVTPLLNPIIYSLRNKDLKKSTINMLNRRLHLNLN